MLSDEQQETWFAYMRVMLRLNYEMNRELQTGSDLSLPDYHVLNALGDSPDGRLQLTALAARIAWERSRVSHHLRRMAGRGLVGLTPSRVDGRATDAVLTAAGRAALRAATPGHAALVGRMFFEGLDAELLGPLRTALEQIHDQVLRTGTLPVPGEPQHRLSGLSDEA
ncbi:DNA-binding transcriptional regulator, MarR family [Friedmanniella luteola]|uniref:DNA-binding transcriptional regulator, MarR family n=1 Tax=Friedmanniella luteola TaxID=546871 RepID=A0A1H1N5D6_9ACTN|nr:MarR family winged helix-turn-helix transcriptional regulator [Friedmanniella luteola]SDR94361.1 DNA-binding transcriptional regulator, MarR family [Friedmanniella luteola]